jgi:Domain of unknown function (DUF4112)
MLEQPSQSALTLPPDRIAKLAHLRKLSVLWDESLRIPGTNFRVGLESVIGLLPFGGDAIGILLSCYILYHAVQFKLPQSVLVKMVSNILIDGIAGSVPVLGDLFDSTWKANTRNVDLLEQHLKHPTKTSPLVSRKFVILLGVGIIVIMTALATASILLITALVRLLT